MRVKNRQSSLPSLWLISDARNDAALERALKGLPRGSGFIYRHYHLPAEERRVRFVRLQRVARRFGHISLLSADARTARQWGADGAYGPPPVVSRGPRALRMATVHSLRELRQARRADAVLLSPVFPTASHPGGAVLGPLRFRLLAAQAQVPVIALGGMTRRRARGFSRWAAIDGLS